MEQIKAGTAILLSAGDHARSGFWRWTLSAIALVFGYYALVFIIKVLYLAVFHLENPFTPFADVVGLERGGALLLTSYIYLALAAAIPVLAVSLRILNLKISDIVSPQTRPNWYLALITAISVFGVSAIITLMQLWIYDEPGTVTFTPLSGLALIYIPILIVAITFQATAEELVFRGYFVQLAGRWTQSWWVITLTTGTLYFVFYEQDQIFDLANWAVYLRYILAALLFTLLALITGRLEYSIGAHIGMNWGLLILDFKPPSEPYLYSGAGAILYTGSIEPSFLDGVSLFLETFIVFAICLLIHFRYFKTHKVSA